jgi:rRNA maturation RNase YbeY
VADHNLPGASMGVEVINRSARKKISSRRVKVTADAILDLLKQKGAHLSIALVGNRAIRSLNAKYRNKDAPTDVLSFTAGDLLPGGEKLLGDVVISVDQAMKQAREKGVSFENEMEILLIHGILHLLGYDHERSRRDAQIMQRLERKLLRALGAKGI